MTLNPDTPQKNSGGGEYVAKRKPHSIIRSGLISRGDWICTSDLLLPKQRCRQINYDILSGFIERLGVGAAGKESLFAEGPFPFP